MARRRHARERAGAHARTCGRFDRACTLIQNFVYRPLMAEKALFWVGSSLADTRAFPVEARQRAGYELYLVQQGQEPSDWKPMPAVGAGVREIRIHSEGEYRVFYVASFAEGIYVLHSFPKKTQRTRQADIELGRARYADVVRARKRR